MRKLITMLTIVALAFATTFTTVRANAATHLLYSTQQQHLKKDGTPDKRFKENKTPKGPMTKSGKPDMRYKANKPAATKAVKKKK
jgi:hypothetical protein